MAPGNKRREPYSRRITCVRKPPSDEQSPHAKIAVGVCDELGHLLGAITVDDVLDRTLPTGWRQRRRAGTGGAARTPMGVKSS